MRKVDVEPRIEEKMEEEEEEEEEGGLTDDCGGEGELEKCIEK